MTDRLDDAVTADWVPVHYDEHSTFTEIYGFAGSQGVVNLDAIRFRPAGRPSPTLVVMMHPAAALHYMPFPRALAAAGVDVLCAGSRYLRNDTPLIMEKVALDLAAYLTHARSELGGPSAQRRRARRNSQQSPRNKVGRRLVRATRFKRRPLRDRFVHVCD